MLSKSYKQMLDFKEPARISQTKEAKTLAMLTASETRLLTYRSRRLKLMGRGTEYCTMGQTLKVGLNIVSYNSFVIVKQFNRYVPKYK